MPTTEELNVELLRVRTQGYAHENSLMTLDGRVTAVEEKIDDLKQENLAIRQILVGEPPEETGGFRGDLVAFKAKAMIILVFIVFTFGLKVADILGWTPQLKLFVK